MGSILNYRLTAETPTAELQQIWREARDESESEQGSPRAQRMARERMEIAREALKARGEVPNPIIRTTHLRAYPGWQIDQYADGRYVARESNGLSLGPGEHSFEDALYFVKHGEPR